jgi:hypothetical protein
MKPILTPSAAETVRCVRETLETWIAPALTGKSEISYVTTAAHLLSFVEGRIEHEGQLLFDEIRQLHGLFPQALDWLATRPGSEALAEAIRASLDFKRDPEIYPSLSLVADEVALLRRHVCDLLVLLNRADSSGGEALHAALRAYIDRQLAQEGMIVETAFRGRGPRR